MMAGAAIAAVIIAITYLATVDWIHPNNSEKP